MSNVGEQANKIATQAVREAEVKKLHEEERVLRDKLDNLESLVKAEAAQRHFALDLYSFDTDKAHWWYNRPANPDHRWRGLLKLEEKARAMGLTTKIICNDNHWFGYEFKLIVSWR